MPNLHVWTGLFQQKGSAGDESNTANNNNPLREVGYTYVH